jgi:hypothetical protein
MREHILSGIAMAIVIDDYKKYSLAQRSYTERR